MSAFVAWDLAPDSSTAALPFVACPARKKYLLKQCAASKHSDGSWSVQTPGKRNQDLGRWPGASGRRPLGQRDCRLPQGKRDSRNAIAVSGDHRLTVIIKPDFGDSSISIAISSACQDAKRANVA